MRHAPRCLIVTPEWLASAGGLPNYLIAVTTALQGRGWRVGVASPAWRDFPPVPMHRDDALTSEVEEFPFQMSRFYPPWYTSILQVQRHLWETIRRFRPDLVYVQHMPYHFLAWLAAEPARAADASLVMRCHDLVMGRAPLDVLRTIVQNSRLYHRYELIQATNEPMRVALLQAFGVEPARVTVVSNAAPVAEYTRRAEFSSQLNAIFIGGILRYRALPRAVAAMRRTGQDWKLTVVGDGPALTDVARCCAEQGVVFRHIPPSTTNVLEEYLVNATVGLGSFSGRPVERYQLLTKLVDYMAVGLPFLTGDSLASVDLVERTGGGLAVPCNVGSLATAFKSLSDREAWNAFSDAGYEARMRFDINAVADVAASQLGEVLARRRSHAASPRGAN